MKKKERFGRALITIGAVAISCNMRNLCFADAVSDARNELNSIKNQITANQSAISAVEDEVQGYLDEISILDSDIATYTQKLSELQSQVDTLNQQVEKYQSDLQNSAQLYNSAEDVYTTRLRAIYENGIPSVFEILVSSDGIGDFFSRLNVYASILEYDQSLIGNMKSQKEYVDYLKTNIEEGMLSLDQLSYDVEKSTNELQTVKNQKQAKVNSLSSSKAKLLAASKLLLEEQETAEANLQKEIAKAAAAAGSNNKYFSGMFSWPTTSSYITAHFGWYSPGGYSAWHSGTDIGVPRGTQVMAAASGKVIKAVTVTNDPNGPYTAAGYKDHSFSAANGYGYGNYIMLDNGLDSKGNRIYTLYAHLSTVSVSAGQNVAEGQVIGYSGNTGNSYGAHLHFEIRVNGTAVDPMSYFN